mmetsp:Transcript_25858/g.66861  ORF Transcript_25858/g.66861 Transcript_25858/m.66861 type:complete len:242 (+) Transcript_25858:99-824(+)
MTWSQARYARHAWWRRTISSSRSTLAPEAHVCAQQELRPTAGPQAVAAVHKRVVENKRRARHRLNCGSVRVRPILVAFARHRGCSTARRCQHASATAVRIRHSVEVDDHGEKRALIVATAQARVPVRAKDAPRRVPAQPHHLVQPYQLPLTASAIDVRLRQAWAEALKEGCARGLVMEHNAIVRAVVTHKAWAERVPAIRVARVDNRLAFVWEEDANRSAAGARRADVHLLEGDGRCHAVW